MSSWAHEKQIHTQMAMNTKQNLTDIQVLLQFNCWLLEVLMVRGQEVKALSWSTEQKEGETIVSPVWQAI